MSNTSENIFPKEIRRIICKPITWKELNVKYQNELFHKELVIFQGKKVSLANILTGCNSSNVTDIRDIKPYIKVLDIAVSTLINDQPFHIGLKLPVLGKIESYYIDRVLNPAIEVNLGILIDSSLNDLIVVSGIQKSTLIELGVPADSITLWNEDLHVNDCKIILVEPENDTEVFNELGNNPSKRNTHLLKVESKLNRVEYVQKLTIANSSAESKTYPISTLLNSKDTIVVSGASKRVVTEELGVPEDDIKIGNEDKKDCEVMKFYWHKSVGNLNHVRKYLSFNTLSDDKLLNIDDKRFMQYPELIISDDAGMGKSTFLTRLALEIKKQDPSRWVIGINLNQCTENLRKEFNKRKYNVEGKRSFVTSNSALGIDFLFNEMMESSVYTKLKSPLEQSVLRHLIIEGKGVTLLFDGYDEICPDFEPIILDLLNSLKKTQIQSIVVATRPFSKMKLENKLRTFSCSLVPFKDDDIMTFFVEFWKADPLVNKPKPDLRLIAEALINKIKTMISDDFLEFMGIPLQCRLMAEVLKDQLDNLDNINKMSISLVDLYEYFVEKKFKIYEETKIGDARGNVTLENFKKTKIDQVVRHHSTLALRTLLDKSTCDRLKIPELSDEEDLTIHIQKAGLCQIVNNEAQFIHKTFAEYLVSKFFVTELKTLRKNEALIEVLLARICLHGEFKVVRAFLDSHVTKIERTETVLQTYGTLLVDAFTKHKDPFFDLNDQTMLHVLVKEDRPNMLRFIVECLAHVSFQNAEVLETLLTVRDAGCETALYLAAKTKKTDLVELFLKCLEFVSEDVKRKLLLASCFRHPSDKNSKIVKDLLEICKNHSSFETLADATLRVLSLPGRFLKASETGDTNELTKILVTDKVTTDYLMQCSRKRKGRKTFKTALNLAAEKNDNTLCVEFLLKNGASINFTNCFIQPPLYSAVSVRNTTMVNYLVENGADLNVKYRGVPVLHEAVQNNFQDMVECLLKLSGCPRNEGGDMNDVKGLGFVNATDVHGNTALHVAAKQGHEDVAQTLLNVEAYVDLENVDGETPLHVALKNRELKFALWLLRFLYQGKSTNVRNENKYRPLHVASQYGHLEVLKLVLENNRSGIDHCDDQGNTPLHIASKHEQEEVVKILLENGAKVGKLNKAKRTPLGIAKRKGNKKIINVLNENRKLQ